MMRRKQQSGHGDNTFPSVDTNPPPNSPHHHQSMQDGARNDPWNMAFLYSTQHAVAVADRSAAAHFCGHSVPLDTLIYQLQSTSIGVGGGGVGGTTPYQQQCPYCQASISFIQDGVVTKKDHDTVVFKYGKLMFQLAIPTQQDVAAFASLQNNNPASGVGTSSSPGWWWWWWWPWRSAATGGNNSNAKALQATTTTAAAVAVCTAQGRIAHVLHFEPNRFQILYRGQKLYPPTLATTAVMTSQQQRKRSGNMQAAKTQGPAQSQRQQQQVQEQLSQRLVELSRSTTITRTRTVDSSSNESIRSSSSWLLVMGTPMGHGFVEPGSSSNNKKEPSLTAFVVAFGLHITRMWPKSLQDAAKVYIFPVIQLVYMFGQSIVVPVMETIQQAGKWLYEYALSWIVRR